MARRILWFSTKASILGGAIYYTNEIGIWGDATQTTQLLEEVTKVLKPYLNQNVPAIKTESLPSMAEISSSSKTYWNKAVMHSSLFVADLPTKVVTLTNCGIGYISKQLEQQTEAPKKEN